MKKTHTIFLFLLVTFSLTSQNGEKVKLTKLINEIQQKIKDKSYVAAQNLITTAYSISTSSNDSLEIDYCKSKLYISKGEDEKSLGLLLKGFTQLNSKKESILYMQYGKELGQIFGRAKDYGRALNYFRLVLKSAIKKDDSLEISSANFNLGSVFHMKNNLDSASYYYNNVIKYHPKHTKQNQVLATTYNNLMSLAVSHNDFDLAEKNGKAALFIHTLAKDTLRMAGALNNLGGISMYKKDLNKSIKYSFNTIELLKNRKETKAKEVLFSSYDNISQAYYLQGNYRDAYDYLFEATEIRHDFVSKSLNSKVAEIEAKYNVAIETEKRKDLEIHHEKIEFWLDVLVFASLMLLVLSWFIYRSAIFKRKNLKLAHVQEKLIDERKIERINSETQVKIFGATLDAKEIERKYIAEILHDSVSTLLSSANMHLYAVKSKFKNQSIPNEIIKAEKIVEEAAEKIRDLSHKLISPVLLKFGLKFSLEDLCEKYSNSQLEFNCSFKNINRFQQNFEIKIHNIIEELINNVLKHSNATKVSITAEESKGLLKINILDNGDGFDVSIINQKDGLGLSQVEARIKVMKGVFNIESSKEKGTHIFMSIPISDKK